MKNNNLEAGFIIIKHTCMIVARKMESTAKGVLLL
jgi:hypothetical protein